MHTLPVAFLDFQQNWHGHKTPKSKNLFVGVNIAPLFPLFCPKTPILGQKVLKIHANINNPVSALSVSESSKYSEEIKVEVRF